MYVGIMIWLWTWHVASKIFATVTNLWFHWKQWKMELNSYSYLIYIICHLLNQQVSIKPIFPNNINLNLSTPSLYFDLQELARQLTEMFARYHSSTAGRPTTPALPDTLPGPPGATLPMELWRQMVTIMPAVICQLVVTLLSSNIDFVCK